MFIALGLYLINGLIHSLLFTYFILYIHNIHSIKSLISYNKLIPDLLVYILIYNTFLLSHGTITPSLNKVYNTEKSVSPAA